MQGIQIVSIAVAHSCEVYFVFLGQMTDIVINFQGI